jgi:glycosyltransferase involved in cell wall biosynthesis
MSNLCEEKGLNIVLDLYREIVAAGWPVRLVLAGPAVDEKAAALIARSQTEFGAGCDYRGPVYGDAKAQFFADIDVFLFPSIYVNEAQPIVLFEAMSYGVPSIATARGCIPEQLEGDVATERGGFVIPDEIPFIDGALEILRTWVDSPSALSAEKSTARIRAHKLHAHAAAQLDGFRRHVEIADSTAKI